MVWLVAAIKSGKKLEHFSIAAFAKDGAIGPSQPRAKRGIDRPTITCARMDGRP
jgi:hypothetical protein